MKHGIFSLRIKKNIVINDKPLLVSFVFLLSGLLFGIIIFSFSREFVSLEIGSALLNFNKTFVKMSYPEIFGRITLNGLSYFIAMYILGGSIFGKYLCPLLSTVKIIGISLITSFLYSDFGLKGLEYALLILFPGKVLLIFAMLIMTKICIDYSRGVLCCDKVEFSAKLKKYCIKTSVVFIIFLLSWTVDFLCIVIFSDLFV